jgi:hypothetical protein
MKYLPIILAVLLPFSFISAEDEVAIDTICTYHAAIVTDTTQQMLLGAKYTDAAGYAMDKFEKQAGPEYLSELETALEIMTLEEAGRIGEITGKVSVFWYLSIRENRVTATYETLYGQSYNRCVEGSNEYGVVEHFNRYEEAIYRIRNKVNPPT